jgi:hypothetical protein
MARGGKRPGADRKVGSRSKITKTLGGALTELDKRGSRARRRLWPRRGPFAGEPSARLKGAEASSCPVHLDLVRLGLLMKEDRSPMLHCGNLGN